jgi:ATP-dependent protease ClpP protease subunit
MAARTQAAPGVRSPRVGYFRSHWRGDLPLAAAVIVSAALVWGLVEAVRLAGHFFPYTEEPTTAALLWLLEVALLVVGVLWWGMGVQRAAVRSVDKGGSMFVAFLTGVVGYGAFIWVGMFWLNSARFVWPDVRATLTGDLHPAVITLAGAQLTVQGDMEFGTMRAVRETLAAHPEVRIVRLESRGGRVAEGLALGRLIADRNLDTLVTGECSSACVTAFVGGNRRIIGPAARIGLHSAGGGGISAANVAKANRASDTFMAARGVDARILARGAATANDDIWFPEQSVLLASALANERTER